MRSPSLASEPPLHQTAALQYAIGASAIEWAASMCLVLHSPEYLLHPNTAPYRLRVITPDGRSPFETPDALIDPWPVYRSLRERHPVYWDSPEQWWLLTRYDDVAAALVDPRFSAEVGTPSVDNLPEEQRGRFAHLKTVLGSMPLFSEGRVHRRIREELQGAFNPSSVDALADRLRNHADSAVSAVAGAEEIDVLADVAVPLSDAAFVETMGTAEADLPALRTINDGLIGAFGGYAEVERAQRALDSVDELTTVLRRYVEQPPDSGVMATLVDGLAAGRLNETDVVAALAQLVTGSLDPTPQILAATALLLAQHPEQTDRVRNDLSLIRGVVEEALRLSPPFMLIHRVVTEDHRCGDAELSAGDHVALLIGAANRDPERFPEPDRFMPERTANRHVTFGVGHHFCMGAGLVRLVTQAAVTALMPVLASTGLAREPQYAPLMGIRKLASGPHLAKTSAKAGLSRN